MTPDEEILRAQEAQTLLAHPLLRDAFAVMERGIVDGLKMSKISDTQTQHELTLLLQLVGQLEGYFREVVETGKMARITREESEPKRKRRET